MSTSTQHAEEDLAFLRRLVEGDRGDEVRRRFGFLYLLWGACWGGYLLLHGAASTLGWELSATTHGVALVSLTVVSVVATLWDTARRGDIGNTVSVRAFRGMFRGIGLSYLIVLAVLLWITRQQNDSTFVRLFAVVAFAGQGAGWYVAFRLQRQTWFLLVALGWYAGALGVGAIVLNPPLFELVAGSILLCLMGVPGYVIVRGKASSDGILRHRQN